VLLASEGYPGSYPKGREIRGLKEPSLEPDVEIIHAGTKLIGGKVVTDGGRVLSVAARGNDIDDSADRAYCAVSHVQFEGMQFRRDIGWRARKRQETLSLRFSRPLSSSLICAGG
jgi:phosphoribosylamine--glycine ligase